MKPLYFPLIGAGLVLTRILVTGASIGESLVLSALTAAFCFIYLTESRKEPVVNEIIHKKVENLEAGLLEVKSNLSSMRAGQSLKSGNR